MRQKSSSGKWRSRQNVASGGKGSKGSGGKELSKQSMKHKLKVQLAKEVPISNSELYVSY